MDIDDLKTPLKSILLVEDTPDDVELAMRVFRKLGIESQVEIAVDGQDALDKIFGRGSYAGKGIAGHLKLIILDLNLPKISGADLLRRLQGDERTQSIPTAALTVSGAEEEALAKARLNVTAYLRKPLEFHSLLNLYKTHVQS